MSQRHQQPATPSAEVLDRAFVHADIAAVMETPVGRRTIAAILELCMHEASAMASNATALGANVARQDIARDIKNWIWLGGGKKNWRSMEDMLELQLDDAARDDDARSDDYDLSLSLNDSHDANGIH